MVFDITLPQLLLVFAVGAATLGPRDLPRAARSLGFLTGRAAKYVRESARTANELLQQAEIPELKQEIQKSMKDMEKIRTQIKSATRINVDPFQNTQQKSQVPERKLDESQQQEQNRVNESSIAAPPAALRGNLAAQSPSTSAAQRELELQLKKIDATKSITERFPSGADVVVECLRQRKFNSDVKESFKKSF